MFGKASQPAPVAPVAQAAQDVNKGATDAEKMKKQLSREYGAALQQTAKKFAADSGLLSDTTLASGSLLGLGSSLN